MLRVLIDARIEPDYWPQAIRSLMANGNREEAQKVISEIIAVCEETREEANNIAIEHNLTGV